MTLDERTDANLADLLRRMHTEGADLNSLTSGGYEAVSHDKKDDAGSAFSARGTDPAAALEALFELLDDTWDSGFVPGGATRVSHCGRCDATLYGERPRCRCAGYRDHRGEL